MSTLASIQLDRPNKLEFDMEMSGDQSSQVEARLAIITPAFEISFKANINGNNIIVDIPPMNGILFPGYYEVKLVFLVGTNYYVPFISEIEFVKPFTVSASLIAKEPVAPIVIKPVVSVKSLEPVEVVEDEPAANIDTPSVTPMAEIESPEVAPDPVTQPSTLTNVSTVKKGKRNAGSILSRLNFAKTSK